MVAGVIYWQSYYRGEVIITQELQLKAPKENILYSRNANATTTEYAYISSDIVQGDFIWRGNLSNTKIVSQKGNQITANIYGRDMFYKNGDKTFKIDTATTTVEAFAEQTKLSFVQWLLGEKAYASNVIATNDGDLQSGSGTNYVTARDASSSGNPFALIGAGQFFISPNYYVERSFLSFAIPNMDSISAASLYLYGNTDYSTIDFYVLFLTSTYSNPLVAGDFDLFDGHQASGAYNGTSLNSAWNTSSYSVTWNQIIFNATGFNAIIAKKNSTFLMAIISSIDSSNTAPTGYEAVRF